MRPIALSNGGPPHVFWRGETSGVTIERFCVAETWHQSGFFFAVSPDLASTYDKNASPSAYRLSAHNPLNLLDPYERSTAAPFIRMFAAEFDEWVDRGSGEPMDAFSFIDSGSLYSYDCVPGSRWHRLFRLAEANGFDAVLIHDEGQVADTRICVVFKDEQIVRLEMGSPAISPANPQESLAFAM